MIKARLIPIIILLTIHVVASALQHGQYKKARKWNFFTSLIESAIWILLLWIAGTFN